MFLSSVCFFLSYSFLLSIELYTEACNFHFFVEVNLNHGVLSSSSLFSPEFSWQRFWKRGLRLSRGRGEGVKH